MGFEALMGNDRIKQNLQAALEKGRTSHFYLISGPEGSGKRTLARLLAAAILCKGAARPCGSCAHCRKVMGNSHPDFITVDDPEKKTVPVDLIRDARADIYVQPNEADKKIYLFPRAQDMGIPGQNALLKILEEPPAYGVFLLLTDNPEKLLPTVRSRCVELAMTAVPEMQLLPWLRQKFPQADPQLLTAAIHRGGGYPGQAARLVEEGSSLAPQVTEFLEAYCARDAYRLVSLLAGMEKWKRDQQIPVLEQWTESLAGALVHRSGGRTVTPMADRIASARQPRELRAAIAHLQKCVFYAQGNVSPAAICGYLAYALR